MKKFWILVLIPFLITCTSEEEERRIQAEKDSLQREIENRDESVNEFFQSLNEIQDNLETIKQKEKIITVSTNGYPEMDQSAKDKINEDILLIYKLMLKNKQTLAQLNEKVKKSNFRIAEFEKTVARLTLQIEERDAQINVLKEELANSYIDINNLNYEIGKLNTNYDSLSQDNREKREEIDKKTKALNTAYYVLGTKKELKEQNVISKKGGFIGIRRMEKLMENFNKDYFTEIDIRETSEISIFNKKAKVVTNHPPNSFYFTGEGKVEKLIIKDAKEFWSVSKYLVIIID
jgi:chromosome segregation ATPase